MHDLWVAVSQSGAFQGAISGLVSAAAVDYHAYTKFKSPDEFIAYDWRIALFRWSQGIVGGLLTGAGLSALLG